MSWLVEDQLRASLLTDLKSTIPDGYFELESNKLQLDASLDKSGHLSEELSWGTAAGRFGHSAYFKNKSVITPRQLSAADVLMNLGMLVAARAAQQACGNVKARADSLNVFDGNAGKVALQLKEDLIDLGLKVRMRDKVLYWAAQNVGAVIVSVVSAVTIALFLFWAGIPH